MISNLPIHVKPYARYLILAFIASMFFSPDASYVAEIFNAEWTVYWQGIFNKYCFDGFQLFIVLAFAKILKVKWRWLFGKRMKVAELVRAVKLAFFLLLFSIATLYTLLITLSFLNSGFVQWWLDRSSPPIFLYDSGGYYFLPNVLNFLAIVVVAPILEEIIFRGFLLHRWSYKWGFRIAIGVSSLLFAILHGDPIGAFVFGIGMCILYLKTQSLYVPILCHALHNLLAWIMAAGSEFIIDSESEYTLEAFRSDWYIGLILGIIVIGWAILYFRNRKDPQEWELPVG